MTLETRQLILRDLVDRRIISDADIGAAHAHAAATQSTIFQALVETDRLSHRDLALARARVAEHPFVDLDRYDIEPENAALLPAAVARRATAFPVFVIDGVATIGMVDPHDLRSIELIRQATHHEIEPVVCEEHKLRAMIDAAYPTAEAAIHAHDPASTGDPTLDRVNAIIRDALEAGASSIHIPVGPPTPARVRVRVNGRLRDAAGPVDETRPLAERIKALAGLDSARTNEAREGTLIVSDRGRSIEATVSVVPTVDGEHIVLRFARHARAPRRIDELGLPPPVESTLREALAAPAGVLLVSGHFVSGRTTTLAAAVLELTSPDRHVLTVEDPPEIRADHVRQIRIDPASGLTVAAALRLAARQDPDVLVVGEIRDAETAAAAFRAAAAGVLVLAAMDADSVNDTFDRLAAFGIGEHAVHADLLAVIHQQSERANPPARIFTGTTRRTDINHRRRSA